MFNLLITCSACALQTFLKKSIGTELPCVLTILTQDTETATRPTGGWPNFGDIVSYIPGVKEFPNFGQFVSSLPGADIVSTDVPNFG